MARQPVLVLDGGLSSELETCMAAEGSGSNPVLHPTLWSAAELAFEPGRARITAVHTAFLRALFEATQSHAVELQEQLKESNSRVERLKQQVGDVDRLKGQLGLAFDDLDQCRDRFAAAVEAFNTSSTTANSLHLFDF